jgi:hypothetical protein
MEAEIREENIYGFQNDYPLDGLEGSCDPPINFV